jgi:hypothetical protein
MKAHRSTRLDVKASDLELAFGPSDTTYRDPFAIELDYRIGDFRVESIDLQSVLSSSRCRLIQPLLEKRLRTLSPDELTTGRRRAGN